MAAKKKALAPTKSAKKKAATKAAKLEKAKKPVPLARFADGQKIQIIDATDPTLNGKTGIVSRRRFGDDGAWIQLDENADQIAGRVMLYPDECAARYG